MAKFEIKRLFKGSVVYGIGTILQRFIAVLLLPFFTHELTPDDYGVISLISLVSIALTGIFNLGTANSIGVLYYKEENKDERPAIIWSTVALLFCVSSLLVVVFYNLAPTISQLIFQNSAYSELFIISFFGLAISTVTEPFLSYLRMEEKSKQFALQSFIVSFLTTIFSILFILFFKWGAKGFILAGLAGNVCMLLASVFFIARKLKFAIKKEVFLPLIRIGFPSIFGLLAFLVIDYGDRQILQRFLGLKELGIYSVGYNFGMVVMVLVNAFAISWSPFFMSFINRRKEAEIIFGEVLRYYLIGFGFLSLFFFAFARPFLDILVAPEYITGYKVVGLVAVAYILRGSYLIFLPALYFEKKLKLQSTIECLVAIVNIALNIWWVPLFGILGSAFATAVSYAFLPFLTYMVGSKLLPVVYDTKRIVFGLLIISVSGILLFIVSLYFSVTSIIFFGIVILLITFFLLFNISLVNKEKFFLLGKLSLNKYFNN